MKYLARGSVTFAVLLSACASQQQLPAPPPLKIVPEASAEPSATPPPLTGAQLLAQQPSEVQGAIKEHQQDGKWPLYRTSEHTLYPYNEEPAPIVDCGGRGKDAGGEVGGLRFRDAKPRRSAEAGQDSFPWPTTPIAASLN